MSVGTIKTLGAITDARPLRISFDSNAWEAVFQASDTQYEIVRAGLAAGRITGLICETAFRIEAIPKTERSRYFAQPHSGIRMEGVVERDGMPYLHISFGPQDEHHPGIPSIQAEKLKSAQSCGVLLMRGLAWMGLPSPPELCPKAFEPEETEVSQQRMQRQIDAHALIAARGVGKAAFDAAGGWNPPLRNQAEEGRFRRACAEWSDGELVCAHIAYRNDILCTDDRAQRAGKSVFDRLSRAWLSATFGVVFMTLDELNKILETANSS